VNVGYTVSGGKGAPRLARAAGGVALPDEFNYAAGVEFVATPRLTILGDIVGRTLLDTGRLRVEGKRLEFARQDPTLPTSSITVNEFAPRAGNLNLLLGTAGAKFNPWGDLLISASVLFPLNDAGLKSRWTTVIGLDYAF
jgi:hypothetical protein